jgi:PKD repeat protein
VTLGVTDDGGAIDEVSTTVSVTAPRAVPTTVSISSRASGRCLTVEGGNRTPATPIVLRACANRTEQRWTLPPSGTAGAITVYDEATCLDAAGGQGRDGDRILIWPCHGGPGQPGPNQTWRYTAAGELRGINSKCIAVAGSPSTDGVGLVLAPCTTASTQLFDVGAPSANTSPVAAFTTSCTNLLCGFTDGSTDADGSVVSWQWTFGDGGTSTSRSPTRNYASAGTYVVTLRVTDDVGASHTASANVTVVGVPQNALPVADFTSSCSPGSCSFTDGSTDVDGSVTQWSWDFGDGATSTARNPSHTYVAGSYTVVLTVSDNGGATATRSRVVDVKMISAIAVQGLEKCVEVENGGQLNGTRIFIVPCTTAAKQRWTVSGVGIASEIRMFGTMCFDAFSGQGNDGDRIILWECHGGPNQRWTLTAAGELRGGTGKCVTRNGGSTADFTEMAIFPCTGAASQRWVYRSP